MSFDWQVVDRTGEQSVKWDSAIARYGPAILPLTVADMDMPAPAPIRDAIARRAARGTYGYIHLTPRFATATAAWLSRIHSWEVDPQAISYTPRILSAWHHLLQILTAPGEAVIVPSPSYPPLSDLVGRNGRQLVTSPLVFNGKWRLNMEEIRSHFDGGARLLLLISPHNPTGRVWEASELGELLDIAAEYDGWIVADEIHADLVLAGARHLPIGSVEHPAASRVVTLGSPAKTFNIAGLEIAWAVISDPEVRGRFRESLAAGGFVAPAFFAEEALVSAYTRCDAWYRELLALLAANREALRAALAGPVPGLGWAPPEGSYLALLDVSAWGSEAEVVDQLARRARVLVEPSATFGPGCEGHVRMSMALPPDKWTGVLERLASCAPPHIGGA